MKHRYEKVMIFVPVDIRRIVAKIKQTLTKLTDREIAFYLEGKRDRFLLVLQSKYNFSEEQAESMLSNIERLTNGS